MPAMGLRLLCKRGDPTDTGDVIVSVADGVGLRHGDVCQLERGQGYVSPCPPGLHNSKVLPLARVY